MKALHFYLIAALFFSTTATGQGYFADPANPGTVYRELKWDNITGTVLLFEDWHTARVKIKKGKLIIGLMVNFDVYEHKALYQNNNQPFEFIDQIDYIETDFDQPDQRKMFMTGFISNQFSPNTFVQVFNEGKYILIKYARKVLVDIKTYGTGNNENKSIELQTFYFLANNKLATPIKLSKSALEEIAGSRKNELTAYLSANNLNPKKEQDFTRALVYLNSFSN